MQRLPKKKVRTAVSPAPLMSVAASSRGFTDLSPELRNQVYRHIFVRKDIFQIPQRPDHLQTVGTAGLSQSSQFLRTCRLVHDEGCSVRNVSRTTGKVVTERLQILYGENEFRFERHHDNRAPFWEPKPKEIGYQDALQFLKMIGPVCVQSLAGRCSANR